MVYKNSKELHEFLNQNSDSISSTDDIVSIIKQSIEKLDKENDKEEIRYLDLERAVTSS